MKRLKIYPKTFVYTLGLLLFIVLVAHALLYFLTPQVPLDCRTAPRLEIWRSPANSI